MRPALCSAPPVHVLVPSSSPPFLDLLAAVVPPGSAEYAAWAVGQVVAFPSLAHGYGPDDFVPLARTHLERVVPGRHIAPMMAALFSGRILEPSSEGVRFTPGRPGEGRARCVRLADGHRHGRLERVTLNGLELRRKAALAAAEPEFDLDSIHHALLLRAGQLRLTPDAPDTGTYALNCLRLGHHFFSVCAQGRVHSPLTSLARAERTHVRQAGERLVGCDVRCCQPLLLALVLAGRSLGGGRRIRQVNQRADKVALRARVERALSGLLNSGQTCRGWVAKYQADCEAGQVYERVQGSVGRWWGYKTPLPDREEVKRLFLQVAYGRPDQMGTPVGIALEHLYPGMLAGLRHIARTLGHGTLPRYLQAVESDLMILGATDRLLVDHPDVPVLTIHDSLVCPAAHAPLVEATVRRVWEEELGVTPRLKTTAFADEG